MLALSPSLATMSTNELSSLLLNNEARHLFTQDREEPPLLKGILGLASASAHYAAGRSSFRTAGWSQFGQGRASFGHLGRGHSRFPNPSASVLQTDQGRR